MKNKRFVYFVTRSENAPIVLREAIENSQSIDCMIFFDLDGARVLDRRFAQEMSRSGAYEIEPLIQTALEKGIKLFGCQMNIMAACGADRLPGIENAGVATFLEYAYEADAVLSY